MAIDRTSGRRGDDEDESGARHRPDADHRALDALLAGDYERAAALFAEATEACPDDVDLLCNHGAALQALGRPDEAAALYRRAAAVSETPTALVHYNLGSALAQAGDRAGARAAYRAAIDVDPEFAEAHGNLGVVLYELGELDDAAARLATAARLAPDSVQVRRNLGAVHCALGDGARAEAVYREACALAPESAEMHALLGTALVLRGDTDAALAALDRALVLDPTSIEARRQLAAVLGHDRDVQRSEHIYGELAAREPGDAWAHNGLGTALEALGRRDEAQAAFRRAIELAPTWSHAHYNLGVSLERAGAAESAIACYRAAIAHAPEHLFAIKNLAGVLRSLGHTDEAGRLYRRAAELAPDDPIASHLAAAMAGDTTARSPAGYVREVFDGYAERYDEHMVATLGYRAPDRIAEAIGDVFGDRRFARAVDIGCGTGLVGRAVRARVDHLEGVDLSPGMLAVAAASGAYDHLAEADIIEFLASRDARWDLILAADVLIYLGDLSPLFAAVSAALTPDGAWGFSIETHNGDGYVLRDTARYAHSRGYVERLAADAGLAVRTLDEIELRLERGAPVPGLVAIMTRASARRR